MLNFIHNFLDSRLGSWFIVAFTYYTKGYMKQTQVGIGKRDEDYYMRGVYHPLLEDAVAIDLLTCFGFPDTIVVYAKQQKMNGRW